MVPTVERKNATATLGTAAGWLRAAPALIGISLVVNAVSTVSQVISWSNLLTFPLSLVLAGVIHLYAAEMVTNHRPSLNESIRSVLTRLPHLFVIALLIGIGTVFGLFLLVIPGFYFLLKLSLAPAACVIDQRGIGASMQTSWDLTEGDLGKILAIQLITGMITIAAYLFGLVAVGGFESLPQYSQMTLVWVGLVALPVQAVITPIAQLSLARIYLENRDTGDVTDTDGADEPSP
ncbi:hypothetical protein Harman_07450 [Haloarcula mannanilytica]|uniref:Glycerophosphoryl diester phosphodiesterase membrane domain-containing protein n=1 Tax=Haloarcula mannanilytica TaxID=2509225 RepID=A0A4C2EHS2_9EURY|nr:YciC family protein [Haloarcula mannanilytica]GCF12810.1 hypothetical protein Harman_07450 [Haloarcula mannanilytica]